VQMGGSDQWGNIVTGTELIRRKGGGEAFAVTTPLIKKADGTKFGKTESGNVWLDAERTSPYKFYQFWINASDEDAENYIKIFTLKEKEEIDQLIASHSEEPHLRKLQKALAQDITIRVHGADAFKGAIDATEALFAKSIDGIKNLAADLLMDIFEGVPQATISLAELEAGVGIIDALAAKTGFLESNGEARRAIQGNAVSVNREKVQEDYTITADDLLGDKIVLLSKGKKNNYLLIVE
jgi:tyrosyl-tRNA synthetase